MLLPVSNIQLQVPRKIMWELLKLSNIWAPTLTNEIKI